MDLNYTEAFVHPRENRNGQKLMNCIDMYKSCVFALGLALGGRGASINLTQAERELC